MLTQADFTGQFLIGQIDPAELLQFERSAWRVIACDAFVNSVFATPTPTNYWYSVLENGRSDFVGIKPLLTPLTFLFLSRRLALTNLPTQPMRGRSKGANLYETYSFVLTAQIEREWVAFNEWLSVRRYISTKGTYISNTPTSTTFQLGNITTLNNNDYNFYDFGARVYIDGNYYVISNVVSVSPYIIEVSGLSATSDKNVIFDKYKDFKDAKFIMGL